MINEPLKDSSTSKNSHEKTKLDNYIFVRYAIWNSHTVHLLIESLEMYLIN